MRARAFVSFLLVVGCASVVFAASSGGGDSRDKKSADASSGADDIAAIYDRGMELVKKGDYEAALERFRAAAKKDKSNPEYVNMVAYTLRKTGRLDEAFEMYAKALKMKPEFPQAREYLGEAHLQALLEQVDLLRSYGPSGQKEYDQLVAALAEAATALSSDVVSAKTKVPDKKSW
ncbi:MAG: tetratricopeptide repeat protein [Gemmatimonadetes bacterium]|nr:tetratricopeptide repeat protein [Gemmatimonadota bacterium]